MIWLAMAGLVVAALAPLGWAVWRGGRLRGRREAALSLHRAQLVELERDLEQRRILPEEHAAARLEVQRRLLADAALSEGAAGAAGRGGLLAVCVLVPLAAVVLYVVGGHPGLPAAPLAERLAAANALASQDDVMIGQLRARLALMDPHSDHTRDGYELLGKAELSRGHDAAAAAAWEAAVAIRFDPTLAVEAAETATVAAGHPTPEATALFRRALAEAPPDAPWRAMAEKRLKEATGS